MLPSRITLKDKTIIVGITGGIAAYKCCELVREFVKAGADVHVILTEAARHFVTPLTLQTLSRNPVYTDMFDLIPPNPPLEKGGKGGFTSDEQHLPASVVVAGGERDRGEGASDERLATSHISLADRADIVLIAPACANTIAKVAHGICDDLLTTTICATKAQVVFAPSMNVNMWNNKITQENVARLKKLGYHFIEPEEGELACGYRGVGRMADLKAIVENINKLLKRSRLF